MNRVAGAVILFMGLFFWRGSALAQQPVIIAQGDSIIITSKAWVYRSEAELQLPDILEKQQSFKPFTDKSLVFQGWENSVDWFRFIVHNPDSIPHSWMILMGHNSQKASHLYQKTDTGWVQVGHAGISYQFEDQTFPYVHHVMPVTLAAHSSDTLILQYDFRNNFKTYVFALLSPRKFRAVADKLYFQFGIIVGILLLFFALNIYLYFALREPIHLWYSAYLLAVNFLILKYDGFERQFLGMDGTLATMLTPIQTVASFGVFLQLHVIQKFLRNINPHEWLYKFTTIVKYNVLVSGIAHGVFFALQLDARTESIIFQWSNKSLTITVFLILIYCIISYRRGFKPAALVFFGIVAFLMGGMEKLFFLESLSYAFPPSLFQWGLIIEAVILSFAMMFSYNSLKKEKEVLQDELNRQNNLAAQHILVAQEAERKRIAEDLHDEIGSTLAVLKLRIQHIPMEKDNMDELLGLIDKASADTRNISHNLMPPEFEKTPFPDLLQGYYSKLNKENRTRFLFICRNYAQHFPKTTELMLYRIIMEITKNILQHAEASEANIQLIYDHAELEIMAEDDGKGIHKTKTEGIGLKNISSRVNYINGRMQIDTGKKGTTIIIHVPYPI